MGYLNEGLMLVGPLIGCSTVATVGLTLASGAHHEVVKVDDHPAFNEGAG